MSDVVIKVENISKQYRLGMVGTGSFSHDVKRWWHLIRGKEDPFLKLGEENVRDKKGKSEYVWALKDVSFDVKRGEVLGIIGKNGAGKSTLLKILSRVTTPTAGEFKVKGRIASLLEVGTGFHPELSGRENIFLNGAILGMSKAEIKSKFDEIVSFSGVERYIDTPVKRYSSGMYVRLAFAVAAHLEPEILIIDEVLAVGDAEFQKKCLGKMKDVAGEGRTVLFVSHNLVAIRELSTRGIYLKNGGIECAGSIQEVLDTYLNENVKMLQNGDIPKGSSSYNSGEASFLKFFVKSEQNEIRDTFYYQEKIKVELLLETKKDLNNLIIDMSIGTLESKATYTSTFDIDKKFINLHAGMHKVEILFDPKLLPGNYTFYLGIHEMSKGGHTLDFVERIGIFNILPLTNDGSPKYPLNTNFGNVRIDGDWKIVKHN